MKFIRVNNTAGRNVCLQSAQSAAMVLQRRERPGTPATSCAMAGKAVQAKLGLKYEKVLPLQLLI